MSKACHVKFSPNMENPFFTILSFLMDTIFSLLNIQFHSHFTSKWTWTETWGWCEFSSIEERKKHFLIYSLNRELMFTHVVHTYSTEMSYTYPDLFMTGILPSHWGSVASERPGEKHTVPLQVLCETLLPLPEYRLNLLLWSSREQSAWMSVFSDALFYPFNFLKLSLSVIQ